ncbi:unnamed protein product [Coregonus sp. 'balchen']|nr:unnamed protein product [Coregonus sp. 'balchen']
MSLTSHLKFQQGITFDEFRSFFQFLNNLEDFAIAMQMYNFASRSIGQGLQNRRAIHFLQVVYEEGASWQISPPALEEVPGQGLEEEEEDDEEKRKRMKKWRKMRRRR